MARTKKVVPKIPHNVKERFRHQNLQRLLENVASHVPQLSALKKETKAKKLRRIVLYMKFLLQKRTQLSEAATKVQEHPCISSVEENKEVVKEWKKDSKVHSAGRSKSRQPQIVFLRKSTQSSRQNSTSATVTSKEALCTERYEPEHNVTEMSSDAHTSLANRESLDDSQHENLTSHYCSPFSAKDLNCDIYPPSYFNMNIPSFENPSFKRPWEEVLCDPIEMCTIHPAKKNMAETTLGRNSPHHTSDTFNPNRSAFPEYVFAESNKDFPFAQNSGLSENSNVHETESGEFVQKLAGPKGDAKDKLPPLSTFNHPSALYPNLYFGNAALVNSAQKNIGFLQDGDNFPLEAFSSGESAPITSSGEWFSSDEMDFVDKMSQESADFNSTMVIAGSEDNFDSCDVVKKFNCDGYKDPAETFCNMERYVNFSQASAPMSFYAHLAMNPDSNISEISSNYVRCMANHNSAADNELQNGIQPKLVRHNDILNFQQNNQGYYHFYPVSRMCDNGKNSESILEKDSSGFPQQSYYAYPGRCDNGANSESIVQQDYSCSPQESYYVYPVSQIYDNGETSKSILEQDNMDSSQEIYYPKFQEEIVPDKNSPVRLSATDVELKRPKMKTRKEHNFFVPNNYCLSVDLQEDGDFFGSSKLHVADESIGCTSMKEERSGQFGHSSFKVGDECDGYDETIVKQEEPEPSLLAEEISYSLNSLDTWYGNCFNVQQSQ